MSEYPGSVEDIFYSKHQNSNHLHSFMKKIHKLSNFSSMFSLNYTFCNFLIKHQNKVFVLGMIDMSNSVDPKMVLRADMSSHLCKKE